MFNLFLFLIIAVAVLLILIIMVQNPKGGGLSSSFGGQGAQSLGGVQNTNNFLDRTTWTLAIALFALILLSNFAIPRATVVEDSQIENTINDREVTPQAPQDASPVATPQDSTK